MSMDLTIFYLFEDKVMSDVQEIKIGEFTIYADRCCREGRFIHISKEDGEGGVFNEIDLANYIRVFFKENF